MEVLEKSSEALNEACRKIVDDICGTLDSYISACKEIIEDTSQDISNAELDSMMMNIPAILYYVKTEREKLGIKADIAHQVRDRKWDEAFVNADGNVSERKISANFEIQEEAFDCIVYDHAYRMIEDKESMAFELYQAAKKVSGRREGGIQG